MNIQNTLQQRGSKYGEFKDNARTTQTAYENLLKIANDNNTYLLPTDKEAMHMVLHKLSRVVCGHGFVKDNWHDISGYAELAAKEYKFVDNASDTAEQHYLPDNELNMMYRYVRELLEFEDSAINDILILLDDMCSGELFIPYAWKIISKVAKKAEDCTADA